MYLKMNKAGVYRGTKYKIGDIIEVDEDLGNRIILNNQGTKVTQKEYENFASEKNKREEK